MPRLFFAFRPSEAVLDRAQAEIVRMRKSDADVRWVDREHMHVTLRFLGEVGEEHVEALGGLLESACRAEPPLALSFRGIGAFPSPARPRVIWAGISSLDETSLASLGRVRAAIDRGAEKLGIPRDDHESFVPHLTLGRVRSPKRMTRLRELLEGPVADLGPSRVEEILLIQSRLGSQGSTYTVRKRASLGKSPDPS